VSPSRKEHSPGAGEVSKMDRLPNEITHMVFAELKPCDVADLRLVCKTFSVVGLQYLVPRIHLIFNPGSFESLRQISEHPVVSQYVKALDYEADALQDFETMEQWKKHLAEPNWWEELPLYRLGDVPPGTSERELRARRRELEKTRRKPHYMYRSAQLRRAYGKFRDYHQEQAVMRSYDYESDIIRDAFAKLPNLDTIRMSTECCVIPRTVAMERAFGGGLCMPYGNVGQKENCGVPQLRSVLLAAAHTGLKLKSLECGSVHWRIFAQSPKIFHKFRDAVRSLTAIRLHIITFIQADGDGGDGHMEIPECASLLEEHGRLRDLVTSAPNLEQLQIHFDWDYPYSPTNLKHVVGDFIWPCLTIASFGFIETEEDPLLEFFKRHADSLKDIALDTIVLLPGGQWFRVWQAARRILRLESASMWGNLTSATEEFDFGWSENDGVRSGARNAVESYILAGGEAPPLEHPTLTPYGVNEDADSDLESWYG